MTSTSPLDAGPSYYRELDGLRGFAILVVLAEHWWGYKKVLPFGGAIGVNVFFVLSGFLITEILLRRRETPLVPALRNFWWRRILRIFPVYYLYLLVLVVVSPLETVPLLPWSATYTLNNYTAITGEVGGRLLSHIWSLCVEEQFYLVWPIVVLVVPVRWLFRTVAGLIIFAILFRIVVLHTLALGDIVAYRATPSAFDPLACGAAIALLKSQRRSMWEVLMNCPKILNGAVVGTFLVAVWLAHTEPSYYRWAERLSSAAFGSSLILTLLSRRTSSALRRIFVSVPLVGLGKISYGLYVYHLLAEKFLSNPLKNWLDANHDFGSGLIAYNRYLITMPVFMSFAIALAATSYFAMERPILTYKSRRLRLVLS